MNIKYSVAKIEDARGINYVSAYSWKETYSGLIPNEILDNKIKNIDTKTEKTKIFLQSYTGKYVVAKDGEQVIGILSYCIKDDEKYKKYGHLDAIYVLKDYQGYGIGKELFKIAVKDFIKKGCLKMKLECMQGNGTINFYKKYGGYIIDTTNRQIKDKCIVKTDVVLFDDLNKILSILE